MAGATSINPFNGAHLNFLDVLGDALNDLRSRTSRDQISIAIKPMLLLVVTDHDRKLIDRLVEESSDGDVQLDLDILTQRERGRSALEGVAVRAASIAPHSGADVDVLGVAGDALKDRRSMANGSGITVAIEASKGGMGGRIGGEWSVRLPLVLGVTLGKSSLA